jgi:hypothetical protein
LCLALFCFTVCACAPRIGVARGAAFDGPLPDTRLDSYKLVQFDWVYDEPSTRTAGSGALRIAPPDSLRLDLFPRSGIGSAWAILIGGGPVRSADIEQLAGRLPSPELVWAAVGRLAVPAVPDTVKSLSGGVLTVDIGNQPLFRAVFDAERLVRLEKAEGGSRRVSERVTRAANGTVTYMRGKATLKLVDIKESNAQPWDPGIWRN